MNPIAQGWRCPTLRALRACSASSERQSPEGSSGGR
jgi:hypothetical protein